MCARFIGVCYNDMTQADAWKCCDLDFIDIDSIYR